MWLGQHDGKEVVSTRLPWRFMSVSGPEILSSTMGNAVRRTAFHIVDVMTMVTKIGVTARGTTSSRDH
jgi:hypothetical protein